MNESLKSRFQNLMAFLNRGRTPYFTCIGLIILGFSLVYGSPRSLPGFLLFVFAASSIYWLKMNKAPRFL